MNFDKILTVVPYREAIQRERRVKASVSVLDPFQKDAFTICGSAGYALLEGKTQVFPSGAYQIPTATFYPTSTRATHTADVRFIAGLIAEKLGLDRNLTDATAAGHDLGQPPWGHEGERILDKIARRHGLAGFDHDKMTFRLIDEIMRVDHKYRGLNLTKQVKADLFARTLRGKTEIGSTKPTLDLNTCSSLEGFAVQLADRLAYLMRDTFDIVMSGVFNFAYFSSIKELSPIVDSYSELSGGNPQYISTDIRMHLLRISFYDYFLENLVENCRNLSEHIIDQKRKQPGLIFTAQENPILFGLEAQIIFDKFKNWIYAHVYSHICEIKLKRASVSIEALFDLLLNHEEARIDFNWYMIKRGQNESLAEHIITLIVFSTEKHMLNILAKYMGITIT